jgi:hypothetical protein
MGNLEKSKKYPMVDEIKKWLADAMESQPWLSLADSGGRRSGLDRRTFAYANHIPERRSGKDRRSGIDRRKGLDRRIGIDRRAKRPEVKSIHRESAQEDLIRPQQKTV